MRVTRLTIAVAVFVLGAITPLAAFAHADFVSSSPQAGDTLRTPPESVTLVFDGELVPDGTGFTVTGPNGAVVGEGALDLDVAERDQVTGAVEISESGTYSVAWTAVSADGHEEAGDLAFSVAAEAPDTAATPPDRPAPRVIGAIVLLVATGLVLRHARRAFR